jgi:hypothetical protein
VERLYKIDLWLRYKSKTVDLVWLKQICKVRLGAGRSCVSKYLPRAAQRPAQVHHCTRDTAGVAVGDRGRKFEG